MTEPVTLVIILVVIVTLKVCITVPNVVKELICGKDNVLLIVYQDNIKMKKPENVNHVTILVLTVMVDLMETVLIVTLQTS